jgi:hypothetical protein
MKSCVETGADEINFGLRVTKIDLQRSYRWMQVCTSGNSIAVYSRCIVANILLEECHENYF